MRNHVQAGAATVRLVPDDAYPAAFAHIVRNARERVWCSIFLIELDPALDPELRVAMSMRELAAARWRGLDVRLLIGGSRTNLLIAEAAAVGLTFAHSLDIPALGFGVTGQRGSHVKLVVADDWVLTGSHNWSGGAFSRQVQDSVAVHSRDLAAYLANVIHGQWLRARQGAAS